MSPGKNSHRHDIFVVGASVGGIQAVSTLVSGLPQDFPGAVFIVVHTAAGSPGMLASILSRKAKVPVEVPADGDKIIRGHVYVAPPGRHMVLNDSRIRLTLGPTENRYRPAIDPLFRSAARFYDSRVVGVVLTGYLDDGTAGLISVKKAGGLAIVQDPEEAEAPSMPLSALAHVDVDRKTTLAELPALIDSLARQGAWAGNEVVADKGNKGNSDMERKRQRNNGEVDERLNGEPSAYVCPACQGTLWEVDQEGLLTFRCRVGHAYSAESMLEDQTDEVERALWASLRSLEENADLSTRLARKAKQSNLPISAKSYLERAEVAKQNADVLRQMLSGRRAHPEEGQTEQTQPGHTNGEAA